MAERRKQQNFEKIYDYLPSAVWNALEAPNREKGTRVTFETLLDTGSSVPFRR